MWPGMRRSLKFYTLRDLVRSPAPRRATAMISNRVPKRMTVFGSGTAEIETEPFSRLAERDLTGTDASPSLLTESVIELLGPADSVSNVSVAKRNDDA